MTPPTTWDMEFADSEIHTVQGLGGDVHVVFAAASATQGGPEGSTSGFLQGVHLVLLQSAATPVLAGLFGRVRNGHLLLQDGQRLPRIPVPGAWQQALTLELEPAQGPLVVLQAQGLACRMQPGGAFRESLFC